MAGKVARVPDNLEEVAREATSAGIAFRCSNFVVESQDVVSKKEQEEKSRQSLQEVASQ